MNNKPFLAVLILGQIVFYGAFWHRLDVRSTDFTIYYPTARLWDSGQNPYDLDAQCREHSRVTDTECGPLAHPPILLPVVAAVSDDSFYASYWRWSMILCAVLAVCGLLIYFLTRSAADALQITLFFPAVYGLFFGSDHTFVLLAVVGFSFLMLNGKDFAAGLCLSLACVKPQYAIVLGLPLLVSRTRAFLGFCCGGAFMVLFSLALVGIEGMQGIVSLTTIMARGSGFGIYQERMVNLAGILARQGLNPAWSWLGMLAAIIGISVLWRRSLDHLTLSIAVGLAVFTSPHAHLYDAALLVVPVALLRISPSLASLLVAIAFAFGVAYLGVYALLIIVIWYAVRQQGARLRVTNATPLI